jgi:hypothetical protein
MHGKHVNEILLLIRFLNEKLEIGHIPYVQSMLLARHIRGDIDAYPPFLMKDL